MNAIKTLLLLSPTFCVLSPRELTAAEPDVKQSADRSAKERSERLKVLHRELALYRGKKRRDFLDEYNSTRWEFPQQKPKANVYIAERIAENNERTKQLESTIADLENPLKPYYYTGRSMRIGEIGLLKRDIRVFQVIDGSHALVEFLSFDSGRRATPVRLYDSSGGSRVQHVTTGGPPRESSTIYLLSGVPTATFRDGHLIELDGFFAVTGNHTYETGAEITNTVFVVEPYDIATNEDMFTRRNEVRTWTSTDGRYTTDAIFVRYERGIVTLMNLEGKSTEVKLSELTDDDRNYVRGRIDVTK